MRWTDKAVEAAARFLTSRFRPYFPNEDTDPAQITNWVDENWKTSIPDARSILDAASAAEFHQMRDLSKQGWSALSDARAFLNIGTPSDIEEAKQCIDLAQASFAETIIASERRAAAAEAALASKEADGTKPS